MVKEEGLVLNYFHFEVRSRRRSSGEARRHTGQFTVVTLVKRITLLIISNLYTIQTLHSVR